MIEPVAAAHVNLNVTDLARFLEFDTTVLGFRVALPYEGAVARLNFGQYAAGVDGLGRGFHDVPAPEGRQGPEDRSVYFEDPDGNIIERVSSVLPDWPRAYLREGAGRPARMSLR
jgi:catechol 2,3-dioxygenase-like lactoylglutathione lyase family enzyme